MHIPAIKTLEASASPRDHVAFPSLLTFIQKKEYYRSVALENRNYSISYHHFRPNFTLPLSQATIDSLSCRNIPPYSHFTCDSVRVVEDWLAFWATASWNMSKRRRRRRRRRTAGTVSGRGRRVILLRGRGGGSLQ